MLLNGQTSHPRHAWHLPLCSAYPSRHVTQPSLPSHRKHPDSNSVASHSPAGHDDWEESLHCRVTLVLVYTTDEQLRQLLLRLLGWRAVWMGTGQGHAQSS